MQAMQETNSNQGERVSRLQKGTAGTEDPLKALAKRHSQAKAALQEIAVQELLNAGCDARESRIGDFLEALKDSFEQRSGWTKDADRWLMKQPRYRAAVQKMNRLGRAFDLEFRRKVRQAQEPFAAAVIELTREFNMLALATAHDVATMAKQSLEDTDKAYELIRTATEILER